MSSKLRHWSVASGIALIVAVIAMVQFQTAAQSTSSSQFVKSDLPSHSRHQRRQHGGEIRHCYGRIAEVQWRTDGLKCARFVVACGTPGVSGNQRIP